MHFETVCLDEKRPHVTLTTYVADMKTPVRPAMLVIPGGGYGCVCSDREGEPIAAAFLARGFNAFVLHYSVGAQITHPYEPLCDAALAMKHIRDSADAYAIDPHKVYAVGFSAGGHLTGSLGTMWKDAQIEENCGVSPETCRPDGVVLCYPVISADESFGHIGSFKNLFRDRFGDEELAARFSLEKRVESDSAPAFLVHTAEDAVVPVKNSLAFAEKMAKAGVLCELHMYPKGPHGMALATSDTNNGQAAFTDSAYARWVDDACAFLKRI